MYTGLFGQDENQNIIQTRRKPQLSGILNDNLRNFMTGLNNIDGWQRDPNQWSGYFEHTANAMPPLFGFFLRNMPITSITGNNAPPGLNVGDTINTYQDRVRQGLIPYLDEQEIQG